MEIPTTAISRTSSIYPLETKKKKKRRMCEDSFSTLWGEEKEKSGLLKGTAAASSPSGHPFEGTRETLGPLLFHHICLCCAKKKGKKRGEEGASP